jgi:hypothetical protein
MAGFDFDLDNVLRLEPGYDMLNRWVFILDKKLVLERRFDPDGPLGLGSLRSFGREFHSLNAQ